jgi:hypothetical protein
MGPDPVPCQASAPVNWAEAMNAALAEMAEAVGAELNRIGAVLSAAMTWGVGVRGERGDPTGDPPLVRDG